MRLPAFLQSAPRAILLASFIAVIALLGLWFHTMLAAPMVVQRAADPDHLTQSPRVVEMTLASTRLLGSLMLPLGAIIGVFTALSIWRGAPAASQRAVRIALVVLAAVLTPLAVWVSVCTFIGANDLAMSERQRALLGGAALHDLRTLAESDADAAVIEQAVAIQASLLRGSARDLRLLVVDDPASLPLPEQQQRAIAVVQWLESTDDPGQRRRLLAASGPWRAAFESMLTSGADGRETPAERLLLHARRELPDQPLTSPGAWFDWLEAQTDPAWAAPPPWRLGLSGPAAE